MNFKFEPSPVADVSPPTYKKIAGSFTDENNAIITSIRGFNSFFDADGFPVLYVINANEKTYIYDKHGVKFTKKHENPKGAYHFFKQDLGLGFNPLYENKSFVAKFNPQNLGFLSDHELKNTSREISILKVGCNRLHVIVGEMIIEVDLTLKSWDFFIPYQFSPPATFNSNFLNGNGVKSLNMGNGSMSWDESFHSIRRDPTDESKYIIYYLYSNQTPFNGDSRPVYLNTIKVDASNYSINYGIPFYLRQASLPQRYANSLAQFVSELEVSPDGSKLAIHDNSKIFVYGINHSSKEVSGFLGFYNFTSTNTNVLDVISGLEFNAQSNKLVFNRFNANATSSSSLINNIGVLNLSASYTNFAIPVSFVTETTIGKSHSTITRGGLELGRNNEIYSVGETGIYKIDLTAMELNEVPISYNIGSISLLNDVFMGAHMATRPLPEQIDGQTFVSEGYHFDDEVLSNINIDNTFTSNGIIKIRGEIKIVATQNKNSVIFNEAVISPATGTIIRVMNEATLEVNNTNIETNNCNLMWQGIIVENGGGLKIQNTSNSVKSIKDAIVAVDYYGATSGLIIHNYTFDRNERAIKINNGGISVSRIFLSNIGIKNNNFKNTQTLKDLTKGQTAINFENANKGISSIEVNQTGTVVKNLLIENNNFDGGLFGIRSSNSFIHVAGCNFSNIKGITTINFLPRFRVNYASAIFSEKTDNSTTKYYLRIGNSTSNNLPSTFSENTRHVTVYNGVSLNVHAVSFSNSYQKGVEWVKNKGCSLEVINSSFLNCANSSIYCDDNAFPQINEFNDTRTYLKILGNSFTNDKYNLNGNTNQFIFNGNAIMINDLGKTANTGYNHLEVSFNSINNLRTGILVNGVSGGKSKDFLTRPELSSGGTYDFSYNEKINVMPNRSTVYPSGMHVVNSNNLAFFQNGDVKSEMVKGIPNEGNAIYIENSPYISIKSNSLKGKYGLRAKMNNIGSEILCNTFSRNRFGIMLSDKHILRNSTATHGVKAVEARSNNFIQSGISDIHWESSTSPLLNRWIIEQNGFVKQGCYQTGTTIPCSPVFVNWRNGIPSSVHLNKIVYDYAPDIICKGLFPAGSPSEILADTSSDPISQWELDFSYALNDLKTNPNLVLTDKIRIIKALEYTQINSFETALNLLNHSFGNILDQKYTALLSKYIGFSYPEARQPDSTDVKYIRNIANKVPSVEGSHVFLARSIMQSLFDEQFSEKDPIYADINIELFNTSCVQSIEELQVVLVNSSGNEIPILYAFDSTFNLQILGESLNTLELANEFTVKVIHQNIEYQVTGALSDLLNNENSINLNCELNLGKGNPSSINKNDNISSLMVFPNPVNDILTIKGLNNDNQKCDINIVDFLGRTIMEVNNHNGNNGLDLSNLNTGVYCLLIKNANTNYKFIIQKQ